MFNSGDRVMSIKKLESYWSRIEIYKVYKVKKEIRGQLILSGVLERQDPKHFILATPALKLLYGVKD